MKVLILGGTGLFGRKTILRLIDDPEVSCVVSMDPAPPREWFLHQITGKTDKCHLLRGDISRLEDILGVLKSFSVDRLVNFAFLLPGEAEFNPRPSTKVNALGMCNAFEAARLMGISRVVYASSVGVYGPQEEYGDREVTEDDHLHPRTGYALLKQYAEIMADQYHSLYGINFTALRPAVGYGHEGLPKGPPAIRWFSEMVSRAAVGKPFSIDVDGMSRSSLCSAEDVAEMTRLLLHQEAFRHPAYNLGGPDASLRDVAEAVRKVLPGAKIEFGEKSQSAMQKPALVWKLSMARAQEDLGFRMLTLQEALKIHINDARREEGLKPI